MADPVDKDDLIHLAIHGCVHALAEELNGENIMKWAKQLQSKPLIQSMPMLIGNRRLAIATLELLIAVEVMLPLERGERPAGLDRVAFWTSQKDDRSIH